MITRPDEPGKRSNRRLAFALLVSLLINPLIWSALMMIWQLKLVNPSEKPVEVAHKDEIVTISSSPRHARRNVADAGHPHPKAAPPRSVARPRIAYQPPKPLAVPEPKVPPVPTPVPTPLPTPVPKRVEIAKHVPKATPEPTPTHVESPPPTTPPEKRVAYAKPERVAPPQQQTQSQNRLSKPQLYSPAQLAQIQNDLDRAVSADRRNNALSSATAAPAAASSIKRYATNFSGINAIFKNGSQGLCWPIKEWLTGSLVYMYMECRVQRTDGSTHLAALPWPVHQPRHEMMYDPSSGFYENVIANKPIDPPDPGWSPDPRQAIDPDVANYLRERGFRV